MAPTLEARLPERVAGRENARSFLVGALIGHDSLIGYRVAVSGDDLQLSGTSYMDELVKIILVEREADELVLKDVPEQARFDAVASAQARGVHQRLRIVSKHRG